MSFDWEVPPPTASTSPSVYGSAVWEHCYHCSLLCLFPSPCSQTLSCLPSDVAPSLDLRSWSLSSPLLSLCFLALLFLFLFLSDSVPEAEIGSVTNSSSSLTKSPGKTFLVIYSLHWVARTLKTDKANCSLSNVLKLISLNFSLRCYAVVSWKCRAERYSGRQVVLHVDEALKCGFVSAGVAGEMWRWQLLDSGSS